ncbi:MAG: GTPase Era [Myxococcota bacterium]
MAESGLPHRAGAAAILGRPNVGKSTLLNRLLGTKLAIVSPRPQTTRSRILGILTRPNAQILLLDTPGLHESPKPLNAAMNQLVEKAVADCDVALVLFDLTRGWEAEESALAERCAARGRAWLAVGTKLDLPRARSAGWPAAAHPGASLSARTGEGVEALLEQIVRHLPESPRLYPEDALSDRPLRFLVAELVREAAFEALEQELPYELAVEVIEFREERADFARIRADLLVQRASQKAIAIGAGGSMIKRIGSRARPAIEELLRAKVHLELWVKVEPKWAKRPKRLKSLGYS